MKKWQVEELVTSLEKLESDNKLYQWRIENTEQDRQEFYMIQDSIEKVALDQSRAVHVQTVFVTAFSDKEEGKCGHARVQFFQNKPLESQLTSLVEQAQLTTLEFWKYPDQPEESAKSAETLYEPLKSDLDRGAKAIYDQMADAIWSTESGEFNSSELFVEINSKESRLSNGLIDQRLDSRIYSEVCFSQRDEKSGLSEEFLLTSSGAHPEQFDFKALCRDSANYAGASLNTELPESGTCAVLLSADVLATLFHDLMSHVEGGNKYYGFPFLNIGDEVVPEFAGTPFKLSLDPHIDYAYGSKSRDLTGLPLKRMALIENNKVLATVAGYQMAQYLKMEPTVSGGNLVIEANGQSFEELLKSEDQVLEILQFSGLFSNAHSLTFSSEIRLAKLHDNKSGTTRYIKGGNLSGNLIENLKGVQFSNNTVLENVPAGYRGSSYGYLGPKHALLSNVSLSS